MIYNVIDPFSRSSRIVRTALWC